MLSVNEILRLYGGINPIEEQNINTPVNYSAEKLKTNLPKIKQNIINSSQMHQFDMIKSNRKLQFYSSFKNDRSSSHQLELIKNMQHRQLVAKLRSGNHDLRIESGRHCIPKVPEHLRICKFCSDNEVENESHFLFSCNLYQNIRKKFFDDVSLKYPNFNTLNNSDKVLFLFNNIDPFICKKLGYFTFEAFQKRKQWSHLSKIN